MSLPIFSKGYRLAAYRLCFGAIKRFLYPSLGKEFEELRPLMRRSKLYITLEEYLSTAFLTAFLVFFGVWVILFLAFDLLFLSFMPAVVLSLLFSVLAGLGIAAIFLMYPSYKVDLVRRDIELNLPYATTHMATIAGTGAPIYTVFKLVSEFKEYGELAKEYGKLSRDIEVFGTDAITAISQAAADTPSPHLKELLWGVVSVIRAGGNFRKFFVEKAASFMEAQRNVEKQHLESLSLFAEMYTTIFMAGPLIFVVMIAVIGSIGNLGLPVDWIMSLVIYLLIPIASTGFIMFLRGSKPIGSV